MEGNRQASCFYAVRVEVGPGVGPKGWLGWSAHPFWCCVQGTCIVLCFCSWHPALLLTPCFGLFGSISRFSVSSCPSFAPPCMPTVIFSSLIVCSYFVAQGDVCRGASTAATAAKGPRPRLPGPRSPPVSKYPCRLCYINPFRIFGPRNSKRNGAHISAVLFRLHIPARGPHQCYPLRQRRAGENVSGGYNRRLLVWRGGDIPCCPEHAHGGETRVRVSRGSGYNHPWQRRWWVLIYPKIIPPTGRPVLGTTFETERRMQRNFSMRVYFTLDFIVWWRF